ncbi:MAG: sulfatase [Pseudomonadales bacterium]|nr:sulfatase [Pseudomonadales bacterium]
MSQVAKGVPVQARNVVVVLLDSLNRHLLGAYGGTEFETPNIDRFAARARVFDRHQVGSLPCMPARHDILCGALDFLWRPWGSIELWEEPITAALRRAGVTTMLVSDHPHLFETGGENYHTDFSAWDYVRGHEGDPWKTRADPSWIGAPALPAARGHGHAYDLTRTWFRRELDFPGPRTMDSAARWLREQGARTDDGARAPFLLFVDEFDPHEPFDTPAPWANRYDPDWQGPLMIWPPYAKRAVERGILSAREARHLRANYGSKLSMIDHWFGRILDALDESALWEDTLVILCTDHGHYLGERDLFGKPGVPHFAPLAHIPLMIGGAGVEAGRYDRLTTSVDLHATLCDLFAVTPTHRTHGVSLLPALVDDAGPVRDWALAGVFGRWVQITDGHRKYARAPVSADNLPLSMWSNRWSTMPVRNMPELQLPRPDRRARLDFMPGSEVPVIRQPFAPGDPLPFWALGMRPGDHHCYLLDEDPGEVENRAGEAVGLELCDLLHAALRSLEAPDEQFRRLGIG